MTKLSPLKADRLEITLNKSPKQFDSPKDLAPNSSTDYILQVDYTDEAGWDAPRLGPLVLFRLIPPPLFFTTLSSASRVSSCTRTRLATS